MSDKLFFCTLFDSHYLSRGIVMIESLAKKCPDFHLYVFAFDTPTLIYLTTVYNNKNVSVISLQQFETPELLQIKQDRSTAEYCWTCTPFTIKYCIENFNLPHCTYLDADLYFYSTPEQLVKEAGNNSVIITPHFYHPSYDQSGESGIYCVQFLYFKNDERGMKVLNWWATACYKWCYARFEWGKFGDQKYLDCWPYIFEGVYICENRGAGMAPWNAILYTIDEERNNLRLTHKPDNTKWTLVFYHFHGVKFFSNGYVGVNNYELTQDVIKLIYKPYIYAVSQVSKSLLAQGINEGNKSYTWQKYTLKQKMGYYLRDVKNNFVNLLNALRGKGLVKELSIINYNLFANKN